jgi:curved DNA-binding protein CbpA
VSVTTEISDKTYYELLQVHPAAPLELVTAAYWRLVGQAQSKRASDPSSEALLHQLTRAYQMLADSALRAQYDSAIGVGEQEPAPTIHRRKQGLLGRALQREGGVTQLDYYEILRVTPEADPGILAEAYATLRGYYLRLVNTGQAKEDLVEALEEAYSVTSDPRRRRIYDDERARWLEQRKLLDQQNTGRSNGHGSLPPLPGLLVSPERAASGKDNVATLPVTLVLSEDVTTAAQTTAEESREAIGLQGASPVESEVKDPEQNQVAPLIEADSAPVKSEDIDIAGGPDNAPTIVEPAEDQVSAEIPQPVVFEEVREQREEAIIESAVDQADPSPVIYDFGEVFEGDDDVDEGADATYLAALDSLVQSAIVYEKSEAGTTPEDVLVEVPEITARPDDSATAVPEPVSSPVAELPEVAERSAYTEEDETEQDVASQGTWDDLAPIKKSNQRSGATLEVVQRSGQGSVHKIERFPIVIGSADECDIVLPGLEPQQARMLFRGGMFVLSSLVGADDPSLKGWMVLQDGEKFELGPYQLRLKAD